MNITNERKLAVRATALGNSANADAFVELTGLIHSASPLVRRLAASAIGKLAGIVPADSAVDTLMPLLGDDHPQVRQYSAKALGAFGTGAQKALSDLRDIYKNPNEKTYVKRSVLAAGKTIRESMRSRSNMRNANAADAAKPFQRTSTPGRKEHFSACSATSASTRSMWIAATSTPKLS